ncbi:hypothetical protein FOXB_16608 [Fusarium oxysporum f. sp. conglutinans Fo5176]|uniref:Uncharacterized protein n=1 Tax=Fusarium oxysporum (strain Fo5176) TaxID=660025 RepID=F9GD74_FUSOF|nr:hypothetical protein FOXB_16608 [Fusarium oxysporum f. sp. conglutinans Fo5176]
MLRDNPDFEADWSRPRFGRLEDLRKTALIAHIELGVVKSAEIACDQLKLAQIMTPSHIYAVAVEIPSHWRMRLYERNRYEKLEEFKWFLGQRFDLKITIFYAERSKIQALGFFGRKIRHPGGVVRSPL